MFQPKTKPTDEQKEVRLSADLRERFDTTLIHKHIRTEAECVNILSGYAGVHRNVALMSAALLIQGEAES